MTSAKRRVQVRQSRQESRARIVAATAELVRRRSYAELSVEEIMAEAGLGRTLFYRHFDDLFDLVLSVARPAFDDLFAVDEAVLQARADEGDRLRQAIAPAVALFAEHGPLIRAVAEASVFDVAVEETYQGALDRFAALTERFLKQVGAPVADRAQTARALTFLNVGYLLDSFGSKPRVTPEAATTTILELWRAAAS
jgi:AcrR family transcriptional regulator